MDYLRTLHRGTLRAGSVVESVQKMCSAMSVERTCRASELKTL